MPDFKKGTVALMPVDARGWFYQEDVPVDDLTVASSALTATASIEAVVPGNGALFIEYAVTAATGTGQTLDVAIEFSPDGGTTWYEERTLAQITTAVTRRVVVVCAGDRVRIRETVGGTASFTRSVTARLQDF